MEKVAGDYIVYMRDNDRYFEGQSEKLFGRQISQVLLIHSNRLNSDYLDELCKMMIDEGYEFISLEEALKDPAYKTPDTFTGNNGISWLHRWAYTQGKRGEFFEGEPKAPDYVLELTGN